MRIIVDADACPGRNLIEKAGKENNIDIIMMCDYNHILTSEYSTIRYIDSGFQNVDMAVINEAKPGDIVVTQDYGVATMALSKKAYAVSPTGYIYNNENIERLLFERHISQKVRRGGGRTTNPKKRSTEDDERLYKTLIKLIKGENNG